MSKNTNLAITITGVYFTYPDVPVSISDDGDRFHKSILYNNGTELWTEIPCTPGSASFEEKEDPNDAGIIFQQKLKFILPGEDATNTEFFDEVRRPVLIKINFNKGYPKLIGCEENPARFERLLKASAKESGSECTFTCQATEPAWWISQEAVFNPD